MPLLSLIAAAPMISACGDGASSTATTLGSVSIPAESGGQVPVQFKVIAPEGRSVDLVLEYRLSSSSPWIPATLTDSGALLNLRTTGLGEVIRVIWDSIADIGFRVEDVEVRLREALSTEEAESGSSLVQLSSLSAAADRIEAHMIHLGAFDAAAIATAKKHDLVVVNPSQETVTPALVAEIQAGVDPADPRDDVIVLGYLFVGEDPRTIGLTAAQMRADSRFVGDGTGPRVDPRGPDADGGPLVGLDPMGAPAIGSGFASYYLDDNSVDAGGGDGEPDRNADSGACFVNAGDPAWFALLDTSLLDGPHRIAGLREILSTDYGRGFGCDGVFLGGMDTCAPNAFTSGSDPVQSEFEWTAAGFTAFIERVRNAYPELVIAQNRGLFFYDTSRAHFRVHPGRFVDFVVFESYRLDRSVTAGFDPYFFADNKFNVAPRLQAEAQRGDGFQVLSLGYAEGPGIDPSTLIGASTVGLETLQTDILEAHNRAGFRHYLTNAEGTLVNGFVADHVATGDETPPVWGSTLGAPRNFPTPPTQPAARVGLQRVVSRYAGALLSWDLAMDQNPVHYVVYYRRAKSIKFSAGIPQDCTRLEVTPRIGIGYEFGTAANTFPFEVEIDGLHGGRTYSFLVRAVDSAGNEDANRVVLQVSTGSRELDIQLDGSFKDWDKVGTLHRDKKDGAASAGPDWRSIKVANDEDFLYLYIESNHAFNLDGAPAYSYSRTLVFFDVDGDPTTGWSYGALGSDLMMNGLGLYAQDGSTFNKGLVGTVTANPQRGRKDYELAIPLSAIDGVRGGKAHRLRMVFINDETWDVAPDSGFLEFELRR